MELKDYTIEELKAEIKRRNEAKKAEKDSIDRCRNCKFLYIETHPTATWLKTPKCSARTYFYHKSNKIMNYIVKPSSKACEKYERKTL